MDQAKFKFPHISKGYLGEDNEEATLNAKFFSYFWKNFKNLNFFIALQFPQRIPKSDFFSELLHEETGEREYKITKKKDDIIMNLKRLLSEHDQDDFYELRGWLHMALRYGLSHELIRLDLTYGQNINHEIELKLIKEVAKLQLTINDNMAYSPSQMEELVEIVIDNVEVEDKLKIMILNHCVVLFYRFNVSLSTDILDKCVDNLTLLLGVPTNDFSDLLRYSVAYRGLAMHRKLNKETVRLYLEKAETYARRLCSDNESYLNKILAKDNLLTLLLTKSKWLMSQNKNEEAIASLQEMTDIDPYDSTVLAEIAFFYFDNEQYDKALIYFEKTIKYGPPGIAMHKYFQALCLLELGEDTQALTALECSINHDMTAVSPRLTLINYFISTAAPAELVRQQINNLLNDNILRGQLTLDEIKQFEGYIQ